MSGKHFLILLCATLFIAVRNNLLAQGIGDGSEKTTAKKPLKISGVYPHLAVFNEGGGPSCGGDGGEGGIGAITPWVGKLWMVTYSPHCPYGSSDKLYSISTDFSLIIHPESVGGTPANRMIHRESNQLITGPYLIDSNGYVRVIPPSIMPGRITATARHLTDAANMVYFYDMEGMLYEANVHTLAVKKLFQKPVPGWHGKGAYTAQRQLIVANNGEIGAYKTEDLLAGAPPKNEDEMGVLASWNGSKWKIIERKQFTDITGPGGIYGAPNEQSPAWSIGWDKRSVILKLLDSGKWYTYRLPKATNAYDHRGGWYTEWPRIREIGNNQMLMDMHGMFYNFPKSFTHKNTAGITPLSSHLRYVPDFCNWNGQLVLATDETTILENPFAGRSQSNLWFGTINDLHQWGPISGWGGPWLKDTVKAGEYSDAFLMNTTASKVLHITHKANEPVRFTIEIDKAGNNQWELYKTISVGAKGYKHFIFPAGFKAAWVRIKADKNCIASATFYFAGKGHATQDKMFASIAGIEENVAAQANLIRPAKHNKNLQVLHIDGDKTKYTEVNEMLNFIQASGDSTAAMARILTTQKDFEIDDASVIVTDKTGAFRLPKTSTKYDNPFENGQPRGVRELESERFMLNAHGTLYEVGRESGFAAIRPVTTHKKQLMDFCTWRGLLVLSGTKTGAKNDGHYFGSNDTNGLWFGAIDDLWKLGKPVGEGGVWKNSLVKANEPSLPYLMTGYDKKKVSITADKNVTIALEVDVDLTGFHTFKTFQVLAGKTVDYIFPAGYNSHWIRAVADKNCKASVLFNYQ